MSDGVITGIKPILVVDVPRGKVKRKKLAAHLSVVESQVKKDTAAQYHVIVRESDRSRGAIKFKVL